MLSVVHFIPVSEFRSVKENKQCDFMVDNFNLTKTKKNVHCYIRTESIHAVVVNLNSRSVECG